MPEELLDRIDQFADDHSYTGRSEVLREASRSLLGAFEDKKLQDRDLMGVVTVVFDYPLGGMTPLRAAFASTAFVLDALCTDARDGADTSSR